METIGVSALRENLTAVLKRVKAGEAIIITSRGTTVAKLVPPDHTIQTARKRLQQLAETAIVGDVLSPIEDEWDVMG